MKIHQMPKYLQDIAWKHHNTDDIREGYPQIRNKSRFLEQELYSVFNWNCAPESMEFWGDVHEGKYLEIEENIERYSIF